LKWHTLVSSSDIKITEWTKTEKAQKVWQDLAEKAQKAWISEVAFDRNGYKYTGRVQSLADGARQAGLKF
jgi:large subunit ribosomal protein L18